VAMMMLTANLDGPSRIGESGGNGSDGFSNGSEGG